LPLTFKTIALKTMTPRHGLIIHCSVVIDDQRSPRLGH
jgi:hypothetical protein